MSDFKGVYEYFDDCWVEGMMLVHWMYYSWFCLW